MPKLRVHQFDTEGAPDGGVPVITDGVFKIGAPGGMDPATVRDIVAAALLPGTGIAISFDSDHITITNTDTAVSAPQIPLTTVINGEPSLVWDTNNELVVTQMPLSAAASGGDTGSDPTTTAFFAAMMSLGPAVYWPMSEISGTTIHDYSGNNRDAALSGTVTLGVPGPIAGTRALKADPYAADLRIRTPFVSAYSDSSFSCVALVKNTNPSAARQTILDTTGDPTLGDNVAGWTFSINAYNSLIFDRHDGGTTGFQAYPMGFPSLSDGAWHLAGLSSNGDTELRFYGDDLMLGASDWPAGTLTIPANTNPLQAGFAGSYASTGSLDQDGTQNLLGCMAHVAWFDHVLADADFANLYAAIG